MAANSIVELEIGNARQSQRIKLSPSRRLAVSPFRPPPSPFRHRSALTRGVSVLGDARRPFLGKPSPPLFEPPLARGEPAGDRTHLAKRVGLASQVIAQKSLVRSKHRMAESRTNLQIAPSIRRIFGGNNLSRRSQRLTLPWTTRKRLRGSWL